MGVGMNGENMNGSLIKTFLVVTGIPLILILFGDFQRRTLLKDSLSLLTIITFCVLAWQFYWSVKNSSMLNGRQMKSWMGLHNAVGYFAVVILFLHPIFLVFPRFFEKGMTPSEAFFTIITTLGSSGIVLGIVSWGSMVILALTSFFRKDLPFRYSTWRRFHGVLSALFLFTGSWHAVALGRHISFPLAVLIILNCILALLLYSRKFFIQQSPIQVKMNG